MMAHDGPVIESLDHLVLTVEDLEATCRFYVDGLGMALMRFGENDSRLALRFGRQKLNLHQRGREFEPKAVRPTPALPTSVS
jgi:catechol 2,3-dioxygenase-like lactoylglutathione lyase family enzyme